MAITYIIGNGYDIQSGLKTNYPAFISFLSEKYKEITRNDLINHITNDRSNFWSDLEKGLGEYTKMLKTEKEKKKFIKDHEELFNELGDYLENNQLEDSYSQEEQNRIIRTTMDNISKTLSNSAERKVIEAKLKESRYHNVNVLTVNYTNTINNVLGNGKLNVTNIYNSTYFYIFNRTPIHIHGTLEEYMTFGVDNIEQMNSELFSEEEILYFIKPKMLDACGEDMKRNGEELIDASDIYIIFGMSIGETDKFWWKKISNNLLKNENKILILNYYSSEALNKRSFKSTNEKKDVIKETFLAMSELNENEINKIKNQILIDFNNNHVFNIND